MKRLLDFLLSRWYFPAVDYWMAVDEKNKLSRELRRAKERLDWQLHKLTQMELSYRLKCDEMAQKALESDLIQHLQHENQSLALGFADNTATKWADPTSSVL